MKSFLENAEALVQLASDYELTALSAKRANGEAVDVMVSISTRIQIEEARNETRREELRATIADTAGRSEIVRKMAALELEALERKAPEITEAEKALFDSKVKEANAALAEMRKLEAQISSARAALKQQIDTDFKLSNISKLDALLLSRHIESTQEEFSRRFRK